VQRTYLESSLEKEQLYGNFEKVVQFTDSDKRYADFRLRIHYDGLRQGEFFRGILIGYLENDEDLMRFINKLKRKVERLSQRKLKQQKKSDKKKREIGKKFALNSNEIENIFDMIEQEFPEL
jgi:hypothetical protein